MGFRKTTVCSSTLALSRQAAQDAKYRVNSSFRFLLTVAVLTRNPHLLLLDELRQTALDEGFIACAVAPAIDSRGYSDLVRWIDAGYAAGMDYFANRLQAYKNPSGVLEGAKSVLVLAYPYPAGEDTSAEDSPPKINVGKVARYTWLGADYHDLIHPKLKRLSRLVRKHFPDCNARGIVDTAPLLEREFAQLAGLGWRGKNTLLLNKQLGSYFFLACLLVDIELPADEPHHADHCGTCTACLDACPTDAFPSPGVLDASKCISYLTIEHRGEIDPELRDGIGDWLFGCDVCQEVCPWNRKPARRSQFNELIQAQTSIELVELFYQGDEEFRERFRKTPMWRTRRRGILRNAAIVLANQGQASALDALRRGARDEDSVVRKTCLWAIEKIERCCDDSL